MDDAVYAVEAEVEATHWWFTERRRLFARLITRMALPSDARILDIGTSTGTNLRMLCDLGFTRYEGLDCSEEAVRWCAAKKCGKVTLGDICELPYPDQTFDLILATDIIEHVDDDVAALREIRRALKPGGRALITVPAFGMLWGAHDETARHKRRYRAHELLERIAAADLRAGQRFYFNYLLFLPILCVRTLVRRAGIRMQSENQLNTGALNRIFQWIFRADISTAPYLHPPFGVSYLVLADRR
jgi:SAM-dependent methyltransferase